MSVVSCTVLRPLRPSPVALTCWLVTLALASSLLPGGGVLRSVLLAPWLEETVLRWGLQDALLRRLPPQWAPATAWLCALAFGLLHTLAAWGTPDAWRALATLWPAWWIGGIYLRQRALLPCIAWHAGFNLLWLSSLNRLWLTS